jgi:tRNA (guanine-N7-)-methyltransferase
MRLRYVEGQYEYLQNHERAITEPEKAGYKLNKAFGNDRPIHVELGCGKGKFLRHTAMQNPDINYFGFEKSVKVAYRCAKCTSEDDPGNYFIVYSNGDILKDVFEPNSIERIYLNFSDPWPKPCNYKRRMTHKNFLDVYRSVLVKNGEVHMKTDNCDLFEYSVIQFQNDNWELLMVTRDLHNSLYNEGNIMTEYEEKFAGQGKPINKLIARVRSL